MTEFGIKLLPGGSIETENLLGFIGSLCFLFGSGKPGVQITSMSKAVALPEFWITTFIACALDFDETIEHTMNDWLEFLASILVSIANTLVTLQRAKVATAVTKAAITCAIDNAHSADNIFSIKQFPKTIFVSLFKKI